MMEGVVIKRVESNDVERLQEISRRTFFEAFHAVNTEEDMRKYLDEALSIERLTRELNDSGSEFYFAEWEGNIIGYLKLNHGPSQTDIKDDNALEAERIYVAAEFQGRQVGQALYEKAVAIAEDRGAEYIWLGVWEHNHRAIDFYRRNGFNTFGKHPFMLGNDEQTDIMMRREIR